MRPTPIFDTNIFGHVQDGSISQKDWRSLIAHRPGHGWRLSAVTALELLVGVHEVPSENFIQQREQIELAYQLSKGLIHEEPRFLICKEILRVPFPLERLPVDVLADHIDVVLRAKSREEILANEVPFKTLVTQGKCRAGFKTSVHKELVAGPKSEWKERVEQLASEMYPRWREYFQETGKRLPEELRMGLESRMVWVAERMKFSESFLRWMCAPAEPESVAEITKRLDAVLEFTIHVTREFVTRNYNLEKNDSDVFDQFQLHYLAMDHFVIVTKDKGFSSRTAHSAQKDRIISFEQFLGSLP